MCGICGQWCKNDSVNEAVIRQMCDQMVHRGPDGDGFFIQKKIGLGMRRLAIIDVDGGWQPIYNEDQSIVIVFNGEVYNYIELRDELIKRGHQFKTLSDTETIVHAYEEFGFDCLQYLNGMFAFALWDQKQQQLWIVRDRLGVKPLYYYWDGQRLIFGSELKALLPALDHIPPVDTEAIYHYLSFQYVPSEWSILQGIHKLPAAHYLLLKNDQIKIERYWDVSFAPQWTDDEATLQERLREELTRAVRLRLRSDVPLGAFLSGGIDSAVIVAIMAQLLDRPVKAHTVSFDEAAFDESSAAKMVAQHVGADHTIEPVYIDVLQDLPRIVPYLDEPFADSSALPTYYLCQTTRKSVTVALSGDGGDEVFGGYQRYTLDRYADYYRHVPAVIRDGVVAPLANRMNVTRNVTIEANYALGLRRLQQVMATPEEASILRWGSFFSEPMKKQLLQPDFPVNRLDSTALLSDTYRRSDAHTRLGRTLYTDLKHYLADNGLVKVDRMSMANSLEVRGPYLDYQLIEFMARVPDKYKVRGRSRKILLRETFRDLLPPSWDKRPKRGFEMPISLWFRDKLYDLAHATLLDTNAKTRPFFRPAEITRLLTEHRQGAEDHGRRLWALLILELWMQHIR